MADIVQFPSSGVIVHRITNAVAAFDLTAEVRIDGVDQISQSRPGQSLITRDIDPEQAGEFFLRFMSLCDEFAAQDEVK